MGRGTSAARATSLKAGAALVSVGVPLLAVAFIVVLVVVLVVAMAANMASNTDDETSAAGVHCSAPDRDEEEEDEDSTSDSASPETDVPSEYVDYVDEAAAEAQVPTDVLAAQIYYESNWQTDVTSHAGASGVAQFTEATWAEYGEGSFSNANNPEMAIAAQGRYMAALRDEMEPHAEDDDQLLELMLASYNAGPAAPAQFNYDLEDMFSSGGDYETETGPYVDNITAAAAGMSGSFCAVPQGDIVEASMELAWADHRTVDTPSGGWQSNPRLGEAEARPEYVETAESIHDNINHAFFTDCGAFVSTVMRSSGIDPNYELRGTTQQQPYLESSDEWETFYPTNEGELEPGDVLIANYSGGTQGEGGHTYIYTGDRGDTEETYARAQGASLGQRPPSGHAMVFNAPGGVSYMAARHSASASDTEES